MGRGEVGKEKKCGGVSADSLQKLDLTDQILTEFLASFHTCLLVVVVV